MQPPRRAVKESGKKLRSKAESTAYVLSKNDIYNEKLKIFNFFSDH